MVLAPHSQLLGQQVHGCPSPLPWMGSELWGQGLDSHPGQLLGPEESGATACATAAPNVWAQALAPMAVLWEQPL